jgi:hypothetical protein
MLGVISQTGTAARVSLGSFSILIALGGLVPGALPPEFAHFAPNLETASVWTVNAYFASDVILLLSGIKLMFGFCTRCVTALAVVLLAFNAYLIASGFVVPMWTILAVGAVCAAILAYIYVPKLRWDLKQPI